MRLIRATLPVHSDFLGLELLQRFLVLLDPLSPHLIHPTLVLLLPAVQFFFVGLILPGFFQLLNPLSPDFPLAQSVSGGALPATVPSDTLGSSFFLLLLSMELLLDCFLLVEIGGFAGCAPKL